MSVFGKKKSTGGALYISPMEGTFRQKVEADTEGAVSRENKNGNMVHELHHETVVGHITNAYIKEGDKYGNQLIIVVVNKKEQVTVIIQNPVSSSYTRKFFMVAGNLDFRAEVEIEPYHYMNKKTNKMSTGWGFLQHGERVKDAIEWDAVPEVKKKKTLKGTEYDDSDALEFLFNKWQKVSDKNGFGEKKKEEDGDDDDNGDHHNDASDDDSDEEESSSNSKIDKVEF